MEKHSGAKFRKHLANPAQPFSLKTQLSHGFPMAYAERRGSDYGTSLGSSSSVGRLGSGTDHHDPLSLHQALQNAVDDQDQNQVCDETASTFMTDLPLLKSKFSSRLHQVIM